MNVKNDNVSPLELANPSALRKGALAITKKAQKLKDKVPGQQQLESIGQNVQNTAQKTLEQLNNQPAVSEQPNAIQEHFQAETVQGVDHKAGNYFLTLSITLTLICLTCGTWFSLLCTVPAIILAISAQKSDKHGDLDKAKIKGRIALILNIVAIVSWVIILVIIIGSVAGVVSNDNYYYNYYYEK